MSRFENVVFYTTEIGGTMTVMWATREEYDALKELGKVRCPDGHTRDLKMVAFARVEDLKDFLAPLPSTEELLQELSR